MTLTTRPRLIAEAKTKSPFGYRAIGMPRPSTADVDEKDQILWEALVEQADALGDWVAVHTDTQWGGSWNRLHQARGMTKKPILAKGIHACDDDIRRALDLGADGVLVVGRTEINDTLKERVFFEPLHHVELRRWDAGLKVVWNRRNLQSGSLQRSFGSQARMLLQTYDWTLASGLTGWDDVPVGVSSILVGEHLAAFHPLPWDPPSTPPLCQVILASTTLSKTICGEALVRTRYGWVHVGGQDHHPSKPVIPPREPVQ